MVSRPDRRRLGIKLDAVISLDLMVIFHPRQMIPLAVPVPDNLLLPYDSRSRRFDCRPRDFGLDHLNFNGPIPEGMEIKNNAGQKHKEENERGDACEKKTVLAKKAGFLHRGENRRGEGI